MSAAQLMQDLARTPGSLVALSVEQYHRMIEEGILEEGAPIELLDGFLVRKDRAKTGEDPMTVNDEHIWAVENLRRVFRDVESLGLYLRLQQPVVLPPDGEPEPDGAIVRGNLDDYRHRKPVAADIACVIEVADSSLSRDRGTKQRIYADAGISQYVIINLQDKVVEIYQRPLRGSGRYDKVEYRRDVDQVSFEIATTSIDTQAVKLLP